MAAYFFLRNRKVRTLGVLRIFAIFLCIAIEKEVSVDVFWSLFGDQSYLSKRRQMGEREQW